MASRKFHVVHVAGTKVCQEGGMSRIAYHWKREFEAAGHSFVHVGPAELGRVWHYSTFSMQARRFVNRLQRRPDILLLHESAAWAFPRHRGHTVVFSHGLEARFANVNRRTPEGQRWQKRLFARVYQRLIWRALQRADRVLLSSQQDRSYCRAHELPRSSLRVFNNGISPSGLAAARCYQQSAMPTVCFNGSWIPRKGTAELAATAAALAQAGVACRWLLMGTGAEEARVRAEWPAHLQAYTTVVPRFAAAEEASLLAQVDVFVLPSHFEGQPLALLQAMEAGLPCVSTNCCGQRDLIQPGENGLLVPVASAGQLTEAVRQIAGDAALRQRLGQAAAAAVAPLTWERVGKEVVSMVERVSC